MDYYILILIAGIGFFSFAILPIGMELAAECTYPVGIATTSGLIVISGLVLYYLLIVDKKKMYSGELFQKKLSREI